MTKGRSRAALAAVAVALPLLGGPAVASLPAQGASAVEAPATTLLPGGVSPLSWAGQLWLPRTSAGPERAGDNYWSPRPDNIFVDTAGRLHLKIVHVAGKWWASQLTSVSHDFGYGTYRWVVDTPLG